MRNSIFAELQNKVIDAGLCTHCGTCAGLSGGTLKMIDSGSGPLPVPTVDSEVKIQDSILQVCPGLGLNYPRLNTFLFEQEPENWLTGNIKHFFTGYSGHPDIRRLGASGGVITQCLIYLLENKLINGAVTVRQGTPNPWQAEPIIATTKADILSCSQSVYIPVPVNSILDQIASFSGKLAYVGLPDQVASVRAMQRMAFRETRNIKYVIGPYVGTMMYFGAIESFLRSHAVRDVHDIISLKYREGEWPGYLEIILKSGRVLQAEKFYYNYLIPFYVTQSSLMSVDFTNELTDISVGDAWHPKFEKQGSGFSVVVARSEQGLELLNEMKELNEIILQPVTVEEALSMHGHMLDFKKRGSFIRMQWRKRWGQPTPDYGYQPVKIAASRKMVEFIISGLFNVGRTKWARWLVEKIPISLLGPVFNIMRKSWKNMSKPTKRKGLSELKVNTWK